jgi:hypothetical protein
VCFDRCTQNSLALHFDRHQARGNRHILQVWKEIGLTGIALMMCSSLPVSRGWMNDLICASISACPVIIDRRAILISFISIWRRVVFAVGRRMRSTIASKNVSKASHRIGNRARPVCRAILGIHGPRHDGRDIQLCFESGNVCQVSD